MTAAVAPDQTVNGRPGRRVSRATILIFGLIVIPFALSVTLNSYDALTAESAIRMAFATVAGQTIAVLSAIACIVLTVKRRYSVSAIATFSLIAALVALNAVGGMSTAGDLLLARLDMIAEVGELNR